MCVYMFTHQVRESFLRLLRDPDEDERVVYSALAVLYGLLVHINPKESFTTQLP